MAAGSNGFSEAEEANKYSEDSKISIPNTKIYTDEECQSLPTRGFSHETMDIKEEDLGKPNSHENTHNGPVIVNKEDRNENQLEITSKQLDISEELLHEEIKSLENNISEKNIVYQIHSELLQENKCPLTIAVSKDKRNSCYYGMQVSSSTAYDSSRSIGVWKHVISKSSTGKTNKVVRKDVDIQNMGCQSVGSRIVKTPYRKNSSLNWFPRKKTESYLERKIKMLQEAEGMMASLDETLVGSNIYLPRVEREKRAVQAAAKEAMETRKAKLVEASWCRILEAARIPCKLAAEELEKADKKASEALARAVALGVTMKNNPSSSKHSCEGEIPSSEEGSNHSITASFETAFEVEKEVAAAVKVAFGRLAHLPNTTPTDTPGDDEGKCRVKSQDAAGVPCTDGIESLEGLDKRTCSSEAKIQLDCKLNSEEDTSDSMKIKSEAFKATVNNKISKELPSPRDVSEDLVGLMLERMKFLTTEELTSLEQIVSTRGLSAVLKEQNVEENANINGIGLADVLVKPVSCLEAEKAVAFNSDLGSVLVRHTSRLEKELQEAKMSVRLKKHNKHPRELEQRAESLDQVLIKRVSRLEREKLAAAANAKEFEAHRTSVKSCKEDHGMPGLGDILRKQTPAMQNTRNVKGDIVNKENKDVKLISKISSGVKQIDSGALKHEKSLVEIVETAADNCDETNIQSALSSSDVHGSKNSESRIHECGKMREEQIEGLDKVIRKMSRLEREKLAAAANAKEFEAQRTSVRSCKEDHSIPGLGDILMKQTPSMQNRRNVKGEIVNKENKDVRLRYTICSGVKQTSTGAPKHENIVVETVETTADNCDGTNMKSDLFSSDEHGAKISEGRFHKRGSIREKEQIEGLDKVLIKKMSRLEKEKLAATENAKEFEAQRISRRSYKEDLSIPGLGEILRKQTPAMKNTRYVKGDIVNEENNDVKLTSKISSGVKQTKINSLNHENSLVETVEMAADNCHRMNIPSNLVSSDEHVSKMSESRFHEHGSTREKEQIEGLDKLLIKKLSRLEREKLAAAASAKEFEAQRTSVRSCKEDQSMPGLGDILWKQTPAMQNKRNFKSDIVNIKNKDVKLTSVTSKEVKLTSLTSKIITENNLNSMTSSEVSEGQPQNQVKEVQIERKDVFNSEMIGFSPKPDAGIWASRTETSESSCTLDSQEKQQNHFSESEGNSDITETSESNPSLPVVMSMLEIEKQQAASLAAAENDPWQRRRKIRTEELQAVWGGMGLGDALKQRASRLELEQAAWRKAEEEERRKKAT